MTSEADAAVHRGTLQELMVDGGPLTVDAAHATVRIPEFFTTDDQPTPARRDLHARILAERSGGPVLRTRQAVVLAGPPWADKRSVLPQIFEELRTFEEQWLIINADDLNDDLIRAALADGTYERLVKPDVVKVLEARGERFWPRELSALFHTEATRLAERAREEALGRGDNIVLDCTLAWQDRAIAAMEEVQAAGYQIRVASVEAS